MDKAHTVRSVEDLIKFCEAAIEAASAAETKPVDPSVILLREPLDMRAVETTLSDGSKVYDVMYMPTRKAM
jgi:hypothetical protein